MSTMITTNVRMWNEDLMQTRMMAGELGMSFNEYINWINKANFASLSIEGKRVGGKKKKLLLINMAKGARRIKSVPDSGFSEDDKIIYRH